MSTVDFLPERIKRRRRRRQELIRNGHLLAVCLGVLVLVWYQREADLRAVRRQLDTVTRQGQAQQDQLSMLDTFEHQHAELLIKKRISDQLGSRVDALDVLSELQRIQPISMSLTDLNIETMAVGKSTVSPSHKRRRGAAARPAGPALHRVRLVLTGLAPRDVDVANFIGQLSASRLFENVTMGYAKNVDFRGRDAREFSTSCYVAR